MAASARPARPCGRGGRPGGGRRPRPGQGGAGGQADHWRRRRASLASYVASKHAILGLSRSAALDLGPLGIRVNTIHPGIIETPNVLSRGDAKLARLHRILARQPLRRIGRADEVASMALFLASDEASYCTGAAFTVDGGHLAGPYREPPV